MNEESGQTFKCIHGTLGTEDYCADCGGFPLLTYSQDIVIARWKDTAGTFKFKFEALRIENEKLHILQHDAEIENAKLNLHVAALRAALAALREKEEKL